jgi:stress-induced morphogen
VTCGSGKPLLARHRAVNAALKEELNSIHAITLKTYTPQQWGDIQAKS